SVASEMTLPAHTATFTQRSGANTASAHTITPKSALLFQTAPPLMSYRLASSFCFPIVLNPSFGADREKVFSDLHEADIQFRIITGDNFLRHDVIRYCDYEIHGGAAPNADTAHDYGFFVGNQPFDLSDHIETLYQCWTRAAGRRDRARGR